MIKTDWNQRANSIFDAWLISCDGNLSEKLLWEMIEEQWCKHENPIPVAQTMSGGGRRRWWICADCGKSGLPKPPKALDKFVLDNLPPQSDYDDIAKLSSEERAKLSKRGKQAIRQKYYDYLKTTEWRQKRDAVMKRDGFSCRLCGNKATQVHHLTYENIYDEPLDDLIAICKPCHEIEHWYKRDESQ